MRPQDLFMPTVVITIVGMMVFPLPLIALDTLLACNITLSLLLLIGAVYLAEPERFTSLPTILLLSTLFRLGLNIATTRQLLGSGEAPDIVTAFGNFVVGGNLVVGAVCFLIVTLVQFLVVAKGAERVAEVAARFTLDAMPGKQMAIDADIRAGILTVAEAKQKRLDLQRESRLYGALDGAMKFVKGDAIAGLVITALNITAGLLLGVMQQGLSVVEAASKYTIFTIGDGLVSQIPALLTAVAAGIAVTRVSDRESSSVGREIWRQLGSEPQALAATSGVLLALAFVPGLSLVTFGCLSLFFAAASAAGRKSAAARTAVEQTGGFRPKLLPGLSVRFSPLAVAELQKAGTMPARVQRLREKFFHERGILVPDFPFDVDTQASESGGMIEASVLLHGVVLRTARGGPDLGEEVVQLLEEVLVKHRLELMDDTHTRVLLDLHQPTSEDLINSVVPKLISVTALTRLFRDLAREDVSIKSLSVILQAIAEHCDQTSVSAKGRGTSPDSIGRVELLAAVRIALRRAISASVSDTSGSVTAWLVEAGVDHLLTRAALSDSVVPPEICDALEKAVVEGIPESNGVLLCTRFARAQAATILESVTGVRVVAIEELTDEVSLRVLGEISLPATDAVATGRSQPEGAKDMQVGGDQPCA